MGRVIATIIATVTLWMLPSVMELSTDPTGTLQLQIHGTWHEGSLSGPDGSTWLSAGFWRQGWAPESGHWINVTSER